jgi:hypothetical protein
MFIIRNWEDWSYGLRRDCQKKGRIGWCGMIPSWKTRTDMRKWERDRQVLILYKDKFVTPQIGKLQKMFESQFHLCGKHWLFLLSRVHLPLFWKQCLNSFGEIIFSYWEQFWWVNQSSCTSPNLLPHPSRSAKRQACDPSWPWTELSDWHVRSWFCSHQPEAGTCRGLHSLGWCRQLALGENTDGPSLVSMRPPFSASRHGFNHDQRLTQVVPEVTGFIKSTQMHGSPGWLGQPAPRRAGTKRALRHAPFTFPALSSQKKDYLSMHDPKWPFGSVVSWVQHTPPTNFPQSVLGEGFTALAIELGLCHGYWPMGGLCLRPCPY